jgi:hypothetical protein
MERLKSEHYEGWETVRGLVDLGFVSALRKDFCAACSG